MGTTDNIVTLHGLFTYIINQGQLYCSFVDMSKAFDYINRDILWYKLKKLGLRGKLLNVIKIMHETVKSKVKYQNQFSEEFDCYLGVRQGEIVLIHLNGIED